MQVSDVGWGDDHPCMQWSVVLIRTRACYRVIIVTWRCNNALHHVRAVNLSQPDSDNNNNVYPAEECSMRINTKAENLARMTERIRKNFHSRPDAIEANEKRKKRGKGKNHLSVRYTVC